MQKIALQNLNENPTVKAYPFIELNAVYWKREREMDTSQSKIPL